MMMPSMVRKERILLPVKAFERQLERLGDPISAAPPGKADSGEPSKMICPSDTRTTRLASTAIELSWVIKDNGVAFRI